MTVAETASIAPEAAPEAGTRTCPNCAGKFSPPAKGPGQHKRFCGASCRVAFGNREKAEGAVIVTLAKIWRGRRGGAGIGAEALAELGSILDLFNAKDREAGRPSLASKEMETFCRDLLRDRYIDRRR